MCAEASRLCNAKTPRLFRTLSQAFSRLVYLKILCVLCVLRALAFIIPLRSLRLCVYHPSASLLALRLYVTQSR